jgi:cyclomaltodextrinase
VADTVSADFVFGTLATDDLRIGQLRAASNGVRHPHELEPPDPRPGDPVRFVARVGPDVRADHVTAYVTTDDSDPAGDRGRAIRGTPIPLERTAVAWDTLAWGYAETWAGTIPGQPDGTLVRYRIEAWSDSAGTSAWATEMAGVTGGPRPPGVAESDAIVLGQGAEPLWPVPRTGSFAFHVDDDHVPGWLRDAVIYQIFIDRFATTGGVPFAEPGTRSGFYGGTLRGVVERLDHIIGLGVTCIWLSPLFPSPSHHGYDATDFDSVEPRLGTMDDLRDLLAAAHEAGLRVILDLAVNHVSSDHPAFVRAQADRDSPYADWFTFTDWPDQYLSFFGVRDHPQIDSDDPGARDAMIDSARRWLELGVDGFRCDYAQGPSHAFWSAFRAATRQVRADSATIGEVVETPAVQRSLVGRLDGCLDFVLNQSLRRFFAFGEIGPSEFDAFLRRHLAFFDGDLVMPSFLDNHDMNRFGWIVGGDLRRLRLAALCQFTLPHPPVVYYGTEVGLSQIRDVRDPDGSGHPEESRLPMLWGEDRDGDLLDFYRRLIRLRRDDPGLWRGTRRTVALDDASGLYAYGCATDDAEAMVVLNTGEAASRLDVGPAGDWTIALTTDAGASLDAGVLHVPPHSGSVLLALERAGRAG